MMPAGARLGTWRLRKKAVIPLSPMVIYEQILRQMCVAWLTAGGSCEQILPSPRRQFAVTQPVCGLHICKRLETVYI